MTKMTNLLKLFFKQREVPSSGAFLISSPLMIDPFFKFTVIYLITHSDDQGTFGFIVNKPLKGVSLSALVENMPHNIFFPVYIGGPVDTNKFYWLHTYPDIKDSIPVADNLYMNGNFDQVLDGIIEGKYKPSNLKIFLGYSGWGKDQLKNEIEEFSWIIQKEPISLIFEDITESLPWKLLRKRKDFAKYLSYIPSDVRYN